MENVDTTCEPEMNFVAEFDLSQDGMVKEIKTEFNIIRLCLQKVKELDGQHLPMLNRIIVMPLRKLLCERNSVLLKICPDFKMPRLVGDSVKMPDNQIIVRPSFEVGSLEHWITVEQWLKQNISWFDRDENNIAKRIPSFSYEGIMKKLSGKKYKASKTAFETLFEKIQVERKGEITEVYCRKHPTDINENQKIYEILDQIGYNKLSIYDFLKHMSDKRGAHIDVGHSLVVEMVNHADSNGLSPIHYFAIQMIYAAKKQIPELVDYWVEMPDLIDLLKPMDGISVDDFILLKTKNEQ